jgi:hypothetical protein
VASRLGDVHDREVDPCGVECRELGLEPGDQLGIVRTRRSSQNTTGMPLSRARSTARRTQSRMAASRRAAQAPDVSLRDLVLEQDVAVGEHAHGAGCSGSRNVVSCDPYSSAA